MGGGGRSAGRRWAVAGGGVAALVVGGLVVSSLGSPVEPDDGAPVDLGRVQTVALQSFDDCDALLRYYRGHAVKMVTPWGLGGTALDGGVRTMAGAESAAAGGAAPAAPAAPDAAAQSSKAADTGATSATGTNVQVAGVDEADVAKLSGDLLVTLAGEGDLHVLRTGRTATRVGDLDLVPDRPDERRIDPNTLPPQPFQPSQLLVHGTTVIVTGSLLTVSPAATSRKEIAGFMPAYVQRSRVAQVDLSDPAAPRLVRTLDVDGSITAARLVDGVVRLVVSSAPKDLTWRMPTPNRDGSVSKPSQDRATAENRRMITRSGLDTWLPSYDVTEYASGTATPGDKGRLVGCEDVASPKKFAGIETLSLVSADLDGGGLARPETTAVVARGATVYATTGRTYVATTEWQAATDVAGTSRVPAPGRLETAVHLFETRDRTQSRYVASGTVAGTLLNQFSMDEHEGVLRVASTTQGTGGAVPLPMPVEGDGAASSSGSGADPDAPVSDGGGTSSAAAPVAPSPAPSESRVTVLRRDGETLAPVGLVSGLGKTEQIRSVRFIGDLGYVVTFRQTDPLYTIDLADPAKPRVAGELKILGYSAYLHPAGPGRLLGVGQDADEDGRITGMQLSLFDISDPAAPKRLDAVGVGEAWTDVEGDHHAFTFADGLALAPYQRSWALAPNLQAPDYAFDTGVLAVRLGGSDLQAPKTLRPIADGPVSQPSTKPMTEADQRVMNATPQRTFVRDGVVYTVTSAGVATHDAAGGNRLGFTSYE
jgi:hypothetical protein